MTDTYRPRRMGAQRRANQEWQLQKAYASWTPPQLRPSQRPPGLSRLPEPRRTNTMPSSPAIRAQVETYDEIPIRLRPAYGLSPLGGYELNQVGAALSAYRCALAKDPHREPLAPRRKLTKQEWSLLLSLAEPDERAHFVRAIVSKRITLKD